MSVSFWTIFCLVYGIYVALQRKHTRWILCINGVLAGFVVSFFCLYFLPAVFTKGIFYVTAASVLAGVALGTGIEKRYPRLGYGICFFMAGMIWGITKGLEQCACMTAVFGGLLGGSCLYLSCAVVLPEDTKEGIWLGLGGILGFWLGVWFGFFT